MTMGMMEIRSGRVTSAEAREPVDPAEVWEHGDLEFQRERAYVTVPPFRHAAPAAGRKPKGVTYIGKFIR